jgi:hypothetical protein
MVRKFSVWRMLGGGCQYCGTKLSDALDRAEYSTRRYGRLRSLACQRAVLGEPRRLVGVEYIMDAATWLADHNNTPPMLEGQAFQFVGSPNRYGIPPFFELHVWAWRKNPNGTFVDWNNKESCEGR